MADQKTFTLPISDCGCFVVGEIGNCVEPLFDVEGGTPKYGVVVWYDNKDIAKAAALAVTDAHWKEEPSLSPTQGRGQE